MVVECKPPSSSSSTKLYHVNLFIFQIRFFLISHLLRAWHPVRQESAVKVISRLGCVRGSFKGGAAGADDRGSQHSVCRGAVGATACCPAPSLSVRSQARQGAPKQRRVRCVRVSALRRSSFGKDESRDGQTHAPHRRCCEVHECAP